MLQRNPLQPPRPLPVPASRRPPACGAGCGFVSAEDFDATGVLSGLDPCESRYWWMPELYGPERTAPATDLQATRRVAPHPTAAA